MACNSFELLKFTFSHSFLTMIEASIACPMNRRGKVWRTPGSTSRVKFSLLFSGWGMKGIGKYGSLLVLVRTPIATNDDTKRLPNTL